MDEGDYNRLSTLNYVQASGLQPLDETLPTLLRTELNQALTVKKHSLTVCAVLPIFFFGHTFSEQSRICIRHTASFWPYALQVFFRRLAAWRHMQ